MLKVRQLACTKCEARAVNLVYTWKLHSNLLTVNTSARPFSFNLCTCMSIYWHVSWHERKHNLKKILSSHKTFFIKFIESSSRLSRDNPSSITFLKLQPLYPNTSVKGERGHRVRWFRIQFVHPLIRAVLRSDLSGSTFAYVAPHPRS